MKKIISLLFLTLTIFFIHTQNVYAFNSDLKCSTKYEVAVVNSNGSYTSLSCTDNLTTAQSAMNAYTSTSTSVASVFEGTKIVDTKYGLLNLRQKTNSYITYMYNTSNTASDGGTDFATYTNGNSGVYAAFMGSTTGSGSSYVAKMMQSGFEGYIRSIGSAGEEGSGLTNYVVTPISLITNAPYYINTNGEIKHYFNYATTDYSIVMTSKTLGPAPSFMTANVKYYSFDGHYFYTNLVTMLTDYKNGVRTNSVNASKPYYNYYQYLSNRTKSTYTSEDINDYIKNVKGYTAKASVYPAASYQSMLYNEGANLIYAQNTFGANALLTLGFGANESGWGRSRISIEKNNIFGYGANDSNPYGGSYDFDSVRNNILYHADYVISSFYCDTQTDSKYYGCHFGDKDSGMNVKYASDPYWAEKMVANYYSIDKALGLSDYNSYKVGVKISSDTINVRKQPNTSSDIIYQMNNTYKGIAVSNMPVVILEEVTGEEIDGNNIWYKIQTDATLDSNRNAIEHPASVSPRVSYNWDKNYGYIHSSLIYTEGGYIKKSSQFYYHSLTWNSSTNKVNISGFLVIKGINNTTTKDQSFSLILTNVDTKEEYILSIDRWTENVPFKIPSESGYDYSGAWFKGDVDLSAIPEGDYSMTLRSRSGVYETSATFRNIFGNQMTTKATDSTGRGYQFRMNYYKSTMPLELFVRDDGLISNVAAPNSTNMFNTYQEISLENNNLNILGTSYNVGGNYSSTTNVERWIILENNATKQRYTYSVGSITNGPYEVKLIVSDNLSKLRAWYDAEIDVSAVDPGTYTIYVRTKTGTIDDYFELNDIFGRTISEETTIGSKKYSLKLNKDKRYRVELVVE